MTATVVPGPIVVMLPDELESLVMRAVERALAAAHVPESQSCAEPALVTLGECAKELRCSQSKVRRLLNSGRLKASRLASGGSSRVLITRASIETLLAECAR